MAIFSFLWGLFKRKQPIVTPPPPIVEMEELIVEKLALVPNPRYQGKLWGYRPVSMIDKIIVHQELGEGNTLAVHNYHISPENHVKPGKGAPKIMYHWTIEKDGWVYQVNDVVDVVWHTKGQNLSGLGIMLVGDFDGEDHGHYLLKATTIEALEYCVTLIMTSTYPGKHHA